MADAGTIVSGTCDELDKVFQDLIAQTKPFLRNEKWLRDVFLKHCELQTQVYQEPLSTEFFNYVMGTLCFFSHIPDDVLIPNSHVLDVGFGEGRALLAFCELFGMRGHGIDKFTYAQTARGPKQQKIYAALSSRNISCLSPYNIENDYLPYPDGIFSLVIFQQVIEHLHNSPKLIFDEIARTLRAGGVLVLDTPNHAFWLNRINLLKGKTVHWDLEKYYHYEYSAGQKGEYFGHTREFTPLELAEMAGYAGLVVETAMATGYSRIAFGRELRQHFLAEVSKALSEAFGTEVLFKTQGNDHYAADCLLPTSLVVARKPT